jgi:glyoxylate carboligase
MATTASRIPCMGAVAAVMGDRHTGALRTYRQRRKFIHVDIEPTPRWGSP